MERRESRPQCSGPCDVPSLAVEGTDTLAELSRVEIEALAVGSARTLALLWLQIEPESDTARSVVDAGLQVTGTEIMTMINVIAAKLGRHSNTT
jgi:hypothetical protein